MALLRAQKRSSGFALIEVLVALFIIAVASTALLLRMQSIARATSFIEDRTQAHWVADNLMQEFFTEQKLQKNIERARGEKDSVEFDGRTWYWSSSLEEVLLPDILQPYKMYRVDIEVWLEQDTTLAKLSGFISE